MIAPGDRVGHYIVEGRLGRGGMGTVWRAAHAGTGRMAALKLIVPKLAGSAEVIERFRREARALGRLRHPNVVDVVDFGVERSSAGTDELYLAMELLDGHSLRDELKSGPLPVGVVVDVVEQVASALDAAHAAGIVHRDLKPENIQLVPLGAGRTHVKVLDFGIAKLAGVDDVASTPLEIDALPGDTPTESIALTAASSVVGTPLYMAPEQFFNVDVDARSDVYALAAVAWEMLTGAVPCAGTAREIALQHMARRDLDVPARVPRALGALLVRALSWDKARRPPTAGAFATLLRAFAAREQGVYEAASRAVSRDANIAAWLESLAGIPTLGTALALHTRGLPAAGAAVVAAGGWIGVGLLGVVASRATAAQAWSTAQTSSAAQAPSFGAALLVGALAGPLVGALWARGLDVGSTLRRVRPLVRPYWVRAALLALAPLSCGLIGMIAFADGSAIAEDVGRAAGLSDALVLPILALMMAAMVAFWSRFAVKVATAAAAIADVAEAGAGARPSSLQPVAPGSRATFGRGLPYVVAAGLLVPVSSAPMLRIAVNLDRSLAVAAVSPLVSDAFASTLVDEAVAAHHCNALGYLLRAHGDLERPPGKARLPRAVLVCDAGVVDAFAGGHGAFVDGTDADGRTALAAAAQIDDAERRERVVKALLAAGAEGPGALRPPPRRLGQER